MEDTNREPLIKGEKAVQHANARSPTIRQAEAARQRAAPQNRKKLGRAERSKVKFQLTVPVPAPPMPPNSISNEQWKTIVENR
jgi:hypothetical protein